MQINKEKAVTYTLISFDALLIIFFVVLTFIAFEVTHKPKPKPKPEPELVQTNVFDDIIIQGKSAYVLDVAENKILFQKDPTIQLPLASITKLMTVLTADALASSTMPIVITRQSLRTEGNNGLLQNEKWELKDLSAFSLITSSNDGSSAIASVVGASLSGTTSATSTDYTLGRTAFIQQMNSTSRKLELFQTYFINETGLDENKSLAGAYGSAKDVGKLMSYLLLEKPYLIESTKYKTRVFTSSAQKHTAENTNIDVDRIPGLIASKTGFTNLAGGNLVVAFDVGLNHPIVVVVLGSTQEGRFADVLKLVKRSQMFVWGQEKSI